MAPSNTSSMLGCVAADEARRNSGTDAVSSARTDEKAKSDFSSPPKLQEGGQLSPEANPEPYPALSVSF